MLEIKKKKRQEIKRFLHKVVLSFVLFASFLSFSANIYAVLPPAKVNLQATIADDGILLEGQRRVVVKLYSDKTPTAWLEIHKNVGFNAGVCTLNLGEQTPLQKDNFDIPTPNFRLIIDGDEIEIPINSVPYAIRAAYAEEVPSDIKLSNATVSNNILLGDNLTLTSRINDPAFKVFGQNIASLNTTLLVLGNSYVEDGFVVSTNFIVTGNRVGIRTPNPQYALDVLGTINATALSIGGVVYSSKTGDDRIEAIMQTSTENGTFLVSDGSNWTGVLSPNVRELLGLAPSAEVKFKKLALNIDDPKGTLHIRTTDNIDTLVVTNNKVAIGHSIPIANLHILGDYPLHVGTASSPNALVVGPSGNVGIQTLLPDSDFALHIVGNLKVDGAIDTAAGLNTDSDWSVKSGVVYNNIPDIKIGIGTESPSGDFHVLSKARTDYLGDTFVIHQNRIGIGTKVPTGMVHIKYNGPEGEHYLFMIENPGDETVLVARQSGNIGIGLSNPGSILHVVKDNVDALFVTKNAIGVGTSSPQALLDLNVSSNIPADLLRISKSNGSSLVPKFIIREDGQVGIGITETKGYLHIVADGNDALVVTKDGVAIGTDTPIALLDVNESNVPTRPFFVVRNENDTKLAISKAGWIAVNTSNPQGVFHIRSDSNANPGVFTDTLVVTDNKIAIGTTNAEAKLHIIDDYPLLVSTTLTPNVIVVSSNGYVGIGGITNPDEALVVSGNLRITGGLLSSQSGFVQLPKAANTWYQNQWAGVLYQSDGSGTGYPFNESGHLMLQTSSDTARDIILAIGSPVPSPRFVLKKNGFIGIGTTVPSGDLHILSSGKDTLIITNNMVGIGNTQPVGDFEVGNHVLLVTNNAVAVGTNDPLHYMFRINGDLLVDGAIYQGLGEAADISDSDWNQDTINHLVYNATDKVGIGTILPLGDFHVVSTKNGETRTDALFINEGNVVIGTANALGYFHVYTPDLPNTIVVTHDGYVGIATSDPKYNVDVGGTLNAQDITIRDISIKAFAYPQSGVMVVASGNNWEIMDIDKAREAIELGSREDFSVTHNQIGIHMVDPQADLHVSGNNNTVFLAQAAGSEGTGNIILDENGKVGIGTLSPLNRFHVVNKIGTAYETCLIVSSNRVGIGTDKPQDLLNLQFNGSSYDTYFGLKIKNESSGSDTYIPKVGLDLELFGEKRAQISAEVQDKTNYVNGWNNPNTYVDLIFKTDNQARMIIKDSGRIGIGTDIPSGDFHISDGSETAFIVTNNRVGIGKSDPVGILQVQEILTVKDNKVGIGITDPTNSLTATGDINLGNNMLVVTKNGVYVGTAGAPISDPGTFALYVDGDARFTGTVTLDQAATDADWTIGQDSLKAIQDFVGIGFLGGSFPKGQLHIINGSYEVLIVTNNRVGIGELDPEASLEIHTQNYPPLKITDAGVDPDVFLVVTKNGNVGIGTNNPGYRLDVAGIMNATEIMIDGNKVATQTPGLWDLAHLSTENGNIIYADGAHWLTASGNAARDILGLGEGDTPTFNKVGIGRTQPPIADLHVGEKTNHLLFVDLDADEFAGEVGIGTSRPYGQFHVKSREVDGTDETDAIVVTNNMIGIGTTNPEYLMDVTGQLFAGQIYLGNLVNDSSNEVPFIRLTSQQQIRSDRTSLIDDGNIDFYTQITAATVGNNNGDVLIYSGGKWESQPKGELLNQIDLGDESDAVFKRVGVRLIDRPGYGLDQSIKGELEVFSGGREALVVTENRVGMGLLTPESTLHILPSQNTSALRITNYDASEVLLVVSKNENIGIGTETPAYKLHVAGIINAADIKVNGDSVATSTPELYDLAHLPVTNGNIIYANGANWLTTNGNSARHVLELGTQDSPAFTNLGLGGQTSPQGPLHVETNTLIVKNNKVGIYHLSPVANLHVSANVDDLPFIVSTIGENFALMVTKDGKVGVATQNPQYDLDVAGVLNAQSILLNGQPVNSTTEGLNALAQLPTADSNFIVGNGTSWVVESGDVARTSMGLGTGNSPSFNQLGLGSAFTGVPAGDLHVGLMSLIVTQNRVGIGTLIPSGDLHVRRAGNDTLVVTNNRIGIGTTDPSDTLEVEGNISLANNMLTNVKTIRFNDYDTGLGGTSDKFQIIARDDAVQIPTGSLVVGTFGGTAWSALSSGNMLVSDSVGIGITAPEASLHVTKDFKISLGTNKDAFVVKDFQDNNIIASINGRLYVEALSIQGNDVAQDTPGLADLSNLVGKKGVFILGKDTGEGWQAASGNYVKHMIGIGEEDRPTFSALGVNSGGVPVGDLHIGANTLVVSGNYVGIGTVLPKGSLHILSEAINALIVTKNSVGIGILNPAATLNVVTDVQDYVAKFKNNADNVEGKGIYISGGTNAAGQYKAITFADGSDSNQIFIGHNNGNLGIGTTQAQAALHISSDSSAQTIAILERNTNDSTALKFENNQGGFYLGLNQAEGFSIASSQDLGSDAVLTVITDNVGIGTTDPEGYLHVKNTSGTAIIVTNNSLGVGISSETPAATLNVISSRETYAAKFEHSNSAAEAKGIYISGGTDTAGSYKAITFATGADKEETFIGFENGNLGIGLTNPSASLNIVGDIPLKVSASSVPFALVVTADGKVGIATANPNVDLDVAGTINAAVITMKSKTLDNYFLPSDFDPDWIVDKVNNAYLADPSLTGWSASNGWGDPAFATQNGASAIGGINDSLTVNISSLPEARTAYISFSGVNDGGYVDVYVQDNSDKIYFHRRINTYQPYTTAQTTEHGNTVVLLATGLESYKAVGVQVVKGSFNFSGIAFSREKHRGGAGLGYIHWDNIVETPFEDDGSLILDSYLMVGSSQTPKGELHVISNGEDTIIVTKNKVAIGISASAAESLGASLNVNSDSIGYVASFNNTNGFSGGNGIYISGGTALGKYQAITFASSTYANPKAFIGFNDGSLGIGTTEPSATFNINGTLLVNINNENTLTVTRNHSVGIGTINPAATLNVVTTTTNYVARFESDTNSTAGQGLYISGGTDAAGQFKAITFADGDWSNPTYISYGKGNLGIGLTNPVASLNIVADSPLRISTTGKADNLLITANSVYVGGDTSSEVTEALNVSGNITITQLENDDAKLIFSRDLGNSPDSVVIANKDGKLYLTAGSNSPLAHLVVRKTVDNNFVGINTAIPTSNLEVAGSVGLKLITTTATTYSAGDEYTIIADSSSNGITIDLPDATTVPNRIYVIKRISASNTVTLDGNGSQTIDSNTTYSITGVNDSVTIQSNGSNWWIISQYDAP